MSTDNEKVSRLVAIAEGLVGGGSDGWAGIQSLVREMEEMEPGSAERVRANLAQPYIARGLPTFAKR